MKLLFIWVNKYRYQQFSKPFLFSPEYEINFSRESCSVQIIENKKYIPNFYGENISEVTAMVGANGSGKTTAALMVMNFCESIIAITGKSESSEKEFVQVFKEGDEIWIYYYLCGDSLEHGQNPHVTKCYDVSKLNDRIYGDFGYAEEHIQHNLTAIYISNVFNPDDLSFRSKLSNYAIGDTNKSLCYTPSYCLRLSQSRKKNQYGQNINGLIISNISQYAERMSDNSLRDFEDYQGELFIRCYKNTPEPVKQELPIFKKYLIGIHQFGSYMRSKDTREEMLKYLDSFDQTVVKIQKKFSVFDVTNQPLFRQCFINILCEADLFFGSIKSEEPQEESLRSRIEQEIEKYLNSGICIIDIELLKKIVDALSKWPNRDFKNLDWYKQLLDSISVFEKYSQDNFQVGYTQFGALDYILDFFLKEQSKAASFFKKYIIFTPASVSSGELTLANTFAYINDALTQKNADNVLLIFDEIDATLHPYWQQSILKNLFEYIQKRYSEKNFQIIFTTHSPIILSDLTADRVIKLEKDNEDNNRTIITSCKSPILGANIERLFYDGFFMNEGSIGEIAKDKISKVLKYIKGNLEISKEEVIYIINNIGEPVVQSKLREKVNAMYTNEITIKEIMKMIQEIGPEQALRIISENMEGGK